MQLTVLTFNVLQLPLLSLAPDGRRRARFALELILESAPDVVVLNEAFSLSGCGAILSGLRRAGYTGTGQGCALRGQRLWRSGPAKAPLRQRMIGSGVRIFSRHPILEQHQNAYRTDHPKTQDRLAAKGVALVKLQLPAGTVWLAGTHLQADEPPVPTAQTQAVRLRQLAELREFVTGTVPAAEPVLLAGDLNLEYFAEPLNRLPGIDHLAAEAILGGRIAPPDWAAGFSYDGTANPVAARTDPAYRNTLDYVGYLNESGRRPEPRISAETVPFAVGREASDHNPVLGRIQLVNAPT
ncbi:MAG: endonuclease/exonuclease/phosphatase family protein [Renibacterium sp.]|nr:endonuclease/exonuclease/phosphatase family protein [Renibacterium sp.]